MDIHKIFDFGSLLYSHRANRLRDEFDTLQEKYRTSFVFYKAFKDSGYSYIAAYAAIYCSTPSYVEADQVFTDAATVADAANDPRLRHCEFSREFNRQIYKRLLLNNVDNSLSASDCPGLIDDTILPYSFLIDVLACKEIKGLALALFVFGALSLVFAAGSVLGVAAATTALGVAGLTVPVAAFGGAVSALLGSATLFFKNQPMTAQADYTREYNNSLV